VGPGASLDEMEKRKFLTLPGLKLEPLGHPSRSQSLYRLSYPKVQGTKGFKLLKHDQLCGKSILMLGLVCGCGYKEYYLMGPDSVQSCTSLTKFRRKILPPSSVPKNKPCKQPANRSLPTVCLAYSSTPEGGGNTFLRNVDKHPPHCNASVPESISVRYFTAFNTSR
jgi:hypothetical protein